MRGSEQLDAVLGARVALLQLSESIGKVQADLDRAVAHLEQEGAAPQRPSTPGRRANVSFASGDLSGKSLHELEADDHLAHTVSAVSGSVWSEAGEPESRGKGMPQAPEAEWPTSLAPRMDEVARPEINIVGDLHLIENNGADSDVSSASNRDNHDGDSDVSWYILHPDSFLHWIWILISVCLLLFDMVFIPWSLAWDIPLDGPVLVVAYMICSFWTLDIILNFLTAFRRDGEIVVDRRSIRIRYLKSWFAVDATILSCDLITVVFTTSSGFKLFRFAKVGRLMRIAGMARMLKIYTIVSDIVDSRLSGYARLAFQFVKMFLVTLFFSHLIACMWYYVGREAPTNTGKRWTHASFDEDILSDDTWYQYFTCFHWAMAQICLGAIEVNSVSTLERIFSIVALILGLLFGSILVSTLSTSSFAVMMDKRELHVKMQLLRRFLRERGVHHSLATQVEHHALARLRTSDKIAEGKVVGLQVLSSSLYSKLKLDLFERYLKHHPLFHVCLHVDSKFVEGICRTCMGYVSLRCQDDLFRAGNVAECAYFFFGGGLEYEQDPASSPVQRTKVRDVNAGSWIAEAALWCHWFHVGSARATQATELAGLWPERLKEVLRYSSRGARLVHDYAKQFHRLLQNAKPPETAFPDDLQVPRTDWSDMVLSMDNHSQVVIGSQAVQSCAARSWKATSDLTKLQCELAAGKCIVMLNSAGKMERVVPVVRLEIRSSAGEILVQLGKVEAGVVAPCCKLPGGKTQRSELYHESVKRLLERKMASVTDRLSVIGYKHDARVAVSEGFGIPTKYLRCTAILSLDGEIAGENVLVVPPIAPELLPPPRAESRVTVTSRRWSIRSLDNSADMETILRRDVFYVDTVDEEGAAELYAWFTEDEFQELASCFESSRHSILPRWVPTIHERAQQMR